MTNYRADLTGDHRRLVAHLLPGDTLILTWSGGVKTIVGESAAPWVEVFEGDPVFRVCSYGSPSRLVQNTLVRQRPPITAALRAIGKGGVAYIVTELRQDTTKYGQPFGPAVPMPAGHVLINATPVEPALVVAKEGWGPGDFVGYIPEDGPEVYELPGLDGVYDESETGRKIDWRRVDDV